MKALKKILCLLLACGLLISCAACTGNNGGDPDVSGGENQNSGAQTEDDGSLVFWNMYWGNTKFESLCKELINEYNVGHPNGQVKVEFRPWATYYQDFLTSVMSGNAPDIGAASADNSILYGRMGELCDLESIVDNWKASGFYDTFIDGCFDLHKIDGVQYGIPWIVDIRMMFVNTELLGEAGVSIPSRGYFTFKELYDACGKLDAKGIMPMVLVGTDFMNTQFMNYILVAADGCYGVDENLQPAMNNPRNIEVYNWIHDCVENNYIASESLGFTADQQIAVFAADNCAIIMSNLERIIDDEDYADKYQVLSAPVWEEGDTSRNCAYINPIVVFNQTNNEQGAKDFVQWYVENNGILFAEGECNFSPSAQINNSDEVRSTEKYRQILDRVFPTATYYVYPAKHLYSAQVTIGGENPIGHMFTELLSNVYSVEELTEKYQAILTEICEENPEP